MTKGPRERVRGGLFVDLGGLKPPETLNDKSLILSGKLTMKDHLPGDGLAQLRLERPHLATAHGLFQGVFGNDHQDSGIEIRSPTQERRLLRGDFQHGNPRRRIRRTRVEKKKQTFRRNRTYSVLALGWNNLMTERIDCDSRLDHRQKTETVAVSRICSKNSRFRGDSSRSKA